MDNDLGVRYSALPSQVARIAFVRELIDAMPLGRWAAAQTADFLLEHIFSDLPATAVGRFKNPAFGNDPRHIVVRLADGLTKPASWRKRIAPVDRLAKACRQTFTGMCTAWGGEPCHDCGAPAAERDHVTPPFKDLVEQIRLCFGDDCFAELRHGAGNELVGAARRAFIELNRDAIIEWVCKACHQRRTKERRCA